MFQTKTVYPDTLELLKNLIAIPEFSELYLVGGTGLALHYGHRYSIDLDFFGNHNIDRRGISSLIQSFNITVEEHFTSEKIFTLFCNKIKVNIVKYDLPLLAPIVKSDRIRVASIKDIAAMKLYAITGRGTKKDFVDLFFLLQEFKLSDMLNFFTQKYENIDPFIVIKSLGYFEDAEKYAMPKMIKSATWSVIKKYINEELKKLN